MEGKRSTGASANRQEKKEEAGQVVPPPRVPFRGSPASLTEGGWPVVCWPAYIIPEERKKFPRKCKR